MTVLLFLAPLIESALLIGWPIFGVLATFFVLLTTSPWRLAWLFAAAVWYDIFFLTPLMSFGGVVFLLVTTWVLHAVLTTRTFAAAFVTTLLSYLAYIGGSYAGQEVALLFGLSATAPMVSFWALRLGLPLAAVGAIGLQARLRGIA